MATYKLNISNVRVVYHHSEIKEYHNGVVIIIEEDYKIKDKLLKYDWREESKGLYTKENK